MTKTKKSVREDKKIPGQSKFKPEYCQLVIDHMAQGYSFASFSGFVGVTKMTIYNWCDMHPEFKEAKSIAMSKSRLFWEKTGIEGLYDITEHDEATGIKTHKKLNATVYCAIMNNRFWKNKERKKASADISDQDQQLLSIMAERLKNT